MSKQVIIKAEQLNATHLGKKVTILDDGEAVMSGKLKELRATQCSMPVFSNNIEAVPNGYGSISVVPKLNYETVTDIIMHLSNQLNDDIKATVRGDTETGNRSQRKVGEYDGKHHWKINERTADARVASRITGTVRRKRRSAGTSSRLRLFAILRSGL